MSQRRLVLNREALAPLAPDELSSVAGAAVSKLHPNCILGSIEYSQCPTCGIACTSNCPTRDCPTDFC